MSVNLKVLKHTLILDSILVHLCRFVPVSWRKMDNTVIEQVGKLVKRLEEAERKARLLEKEVTSIRMQIATLTKSATGLLSKSLSPGRVLRTTQYLATTSTATTESLKRHNDNVDSIDSNQSKKLRDDNDVPIENGYVVVYTDGACEHNGKPNARAGIGAWFGDDCPLNISKAVEGRPTNNTAEIQAPTEALSLLKNLGYTKVKIVTDSQFTINCITKWIKKWKSNNWQLASGGPVKNKEDLVKLDNLIYQFDDVKWEYCAGHKGIKGNEEADKLAKDGARKYRA